MRVSILRPDQENCFQSLVPAGNRHASTSDTSIFEPSGSWIQRCFSAPSDHKGYWGTKERFRGSTFPSEPYSPVSDNRGGAAHASPRATAPPAGRSPASTGSRLDGFAMAKATHRAIDRPHTLHRMGFRAGDFSHITHSPADRSA